MFVALLFSAMGAATLAAPALGIVATFIIEELDISRGLLGWVLATSIILAAVLSPITGHVVDRVGGKVALIGLFLLSTITFATFGLAPAVAVMFVAAAMSGIAQSSANPSTNTLIGEHLPTGERGVVTGFKQSGVQAAITLAGLTLPSLAIAYGWRTALLVVAAFPLFGAVIALAVIPRPDHAARRARAGGRLPRSVPWLATYGALFGFSGAVTFFVALFAEESLGLDPRIGGLAVTVIGIVAFAGRIGWARFAERRREYRAPLGWLAMLGVAASVLMLGATTIPWLLWPGAVLTGAGSSSWNSVGMLAVIDEAGAATGRASGIVLFGFLGGLGIGPPIFGATVDATGSYTTMWLLSIATAALSFGVVWLWRRRPVAH